MGQRSQIYVRANGKLIIARYYQWNYGERMISRARYGIEHIKYYVDHMYDFTFSVSSDILYMSRIFDANFDMKDVQVGTDIFREYEEYGEGSDFYTFVYGIDNNDGQLFIDIQCDKKTNAKSIKYGFSDFGYNEVMTAEKYMNWDSNGWRKNLDSAALKSCKENINKIGKMAKLMTLEELSDFVHTTDYFGSVEK